MGGEDLLKLINSMHSFFQSGRVLNLTLPILPSHLGCNFRYLPLWKKNVNTLPRLRINPKIRHPRTSKFASTGILHASALRPRVAKFLLRQHLNTRGAYFPVYYYNMHNTSESRIDGNVDHCFFNFACLKPGLFNRGILFDTSIFCILTKKNDNFCKNIPCGTTF